jgi:hypothetical protein
MPCRKRALFRRIYLGETGPFSSNLLCIQETGTRATAPDPRDAWHAAVEEMRAGLPATWNAAAVIPIIEVFHVAPNCGMILAWNTANTAAAARQRP